MSEASDGSERGDGGRIRRYPGPSSFRDSESDRLLFHGRRREIEELRDRVAAERMLVLYGKSGIGKTSLLRAGVFPALRDRFFLPIYLRARDVEGAGSLWLRRALEQACADAGLECTFDTHDDPWDYLADVLISRNGRFFTPVLVFDQFEEIFRLPQDRIDAFWDVLAPLAAGHRSRREGRRSGPVRAPDVRIVLSLREEYVGTLQKFALRIPRILEQRYRLDALDPEQARIAIEEPCRIDAELPFASRPFSFEATTVEEILEFIDEDGRVDPIQLQLVCSRAETHVIERDGISEPLTRTEFLGTNEHLDRILVDFYRETLRGAGGRLERFRVRSLCENGLITSDGHRVSLASRQIEQRFGLAAEALERLVDRRLIRGEDRLNDVWYELSHDRIAEAVHASRRRPLRWATFGALGLVLLVALLVPVVEAIRAEGQRALLGTYLDSSRWAAYAADAPPDIGAHARHTRTAPCSDCHEVPLVRLGIDAWSPVAARGMLASVGLGVPDWDGRWLARSTSTSGPCLACHDDDAQGDGKRAQLGGRMHQALGWDPSPDRYDERGLKFPHDVHLNPSGIYGERGKVVLDCADCHELVEGAVAHLSIRFEDACHRCHLLTFDAGDPYREVSHASPEFVLRDLEEYYYFRFVEPAGSQTGVAPARRPGEVSIAVSADQRQAIEARIERVVQDVFTRTTCQICHLIQESGTPGELFTIAPVTTGIDRGDAARFDHDAHQGESCAYCHEAEASWESSDVLLPPLSYCADCHAERDDLASQCTSCHRYHVDPAKVAQTAAPGQTNPPRAHGASRR